MRPAVTVCLFAASLTACVEPAADPTPVTEAASLMPPDCEDWGCTGNTPVMGEEFYELHETGEPNHVGLRVDGLWQAGVRYRPDVIGTRLVGFRPLHPTLKGTGLTGAYFKLVDHKGIEWRLYVEHVSNHATYWIEPGAQKIETYRLRLLAPGGAYPGELRDVCNRPPADSQVGDGNTWPSLTEAVLYTGDRYDPVTKQITAWTTAEAGDWFNIGCAGSVLAKLLFNRLADAGSTAAFTTTRDERNDALAMYTGNVCGTGRSFTRPNTPIRWGMASGARAIDDWGPIETYEAVWGGGRAVCLDTWRLPEAEVPFAKIEAECEANDVPVPPTCASLAGWPGDWTSHGTVESGSPP